ncbi:unnamed protein product [Ectocarpus sp. 6 AP-2014]
MAGKGGMWVFYFLQGEDGDSVENPNAFNIMGAVSEVRLGQFLQAFPLRGHGGQYHFRFRAPDQVSGYCWMDVSDPSAVLPRYGSVICAKALRLDRLPKPRSSRLRRKVPYAAGAATTSGGDQLRASGGANSRATEEAHRQRSAQDYPGNARHHGGQPQQPRQPRQQQQQWSNQGRPRSVSPAHGHQIHRDDVNKGKSVTPPPSYGGGGSKGPPTSRGPPPQSPPPPPPENLEEFLFSDSPTGSPRASPRAQGGGIAHSSTPRGGGSSSGSNNSKGRETGGEGRSGEDLLNFGNDSGGGRPKQAPEPPPRPTTNGGRSPVPAGWGNRPAAARGSPVAGGAGSSNGGASPQGRKSTAGRMQGAAAAGRTNGGGSRGPTGAPVNNGRSNSGGKSVSGVGGGAGAAAASNLHRPKSFSGAAAATAAAGSRPAPPPRPGAGAGGPELMNFNSPRAGGGAAAAGAGGQSAYVKTKVQEREEELKANVEKALEFKKGIDEAASKDQDAMDAAKVKHDAKLTSWAEDHGKKRNVRTLLSTMHLVLWEGNRWKPVSMGDIIQPSKVKLSYRKAMLLVHPDKCGSLGPEERLIAKRVFEAVNEAYTLFQEKEMS